MMDNATLGSPKSQNPKFIFPSQPPQIYGGEQTLDRYQYIGNLETLLNAIEVAPVSVNLSSQKRSFPNHFVERNNEVMNVNHHHRNSPIMNENQSNQQRFYSEKNQKQIQEQQQSSFHSNRLLPPPVSNSPRKNDSNGPLTPAAMSISSLIDLEQPIQASTPLTPPDTNLNMFPGLSPSPTKNSPVNSPVPLTSIIPSAPMSVPSPSESIPFPRLQPSPPSNIFLNTFPLPSVNQAIGDVDRSRNSTPPLISNPNKRKWDATDKSIFTYSDESLTKIPRSIDDYMVNESVQPMLSSSSPTPSPTLQDRQYHQIEGSSSSNSYQTTTVICQHASVAQKSYGSEKRFLCPPPVVIIERPSNNKSFHGKPEISMSVVCENGERSLEQKTLLDENMKGTFKYLHVSGTAKAKYFNLKLKIFNRTSMVPYAMFSSAPVTIISKPSKKTAKARNVSSCILSGSQISLFNRINSQTVRTKYMGIEGGQLCAKNSSWSSFTITVVNNDNDNNNNNNGVYSSTTKRSSSPSSSPSSSSSSSSSPSNNNNNNHNNNNNNSQIQITYGSEIILSDNVTGYTSDRLIIRKVEKGRIAQGACGPVSQMQKIALQSVRSNGRETLYLSAAGPITMDSPHSQDQCTVSGASPYLGYQPSRVVHMQNVEFTKEPFRMVSMQNIPCSAKNDTIRAPTVVEEVDDYLCWTIVGISKFKCTFYEPTFLQTISTPSTPQ